MRSKHPDQMSSSTSDQPHLSGPICLLVHDRPLVHLDDGFRGWWAIAQSTVGSFRVVVFSPFFNQDLGFAQAIEYFSIQELIPEPGIEAFAVPVFPGAAWFDVSGFGPDGFDPILHRLGNELWAVVGTYERRHAAKDKQITQDVDDIA